MDNNSFRISEFIHQSLWFYDFLSGDGMNIIFYWSAFLSTKMATENNQMRNVWKSVTICEEKSLFRDLHIMQSIYVYEFI